MSISERFAELARGATPGEWEWWNGCSWWRLGRKDHQGEPPVLAPTIDRDGHPNLTVKEADRAFIAFCGTNRAAIGAALRLAEAVDGVHKCRRWIVAGDPTYTGPSLSERNDAEDAALRTFRSAAGEVRP